MECMDEVAPFLQEIPSGPVAHTVTMRDVARAARLSVSAVSLALRNSPKISTECRDAVFRIADQLGYRRDPKITELMEHLRTARLKRSGSKIALVIPELTRDQLPHYAPVFDLMKGVGEIATYAGFELETFFLSDPGMSLRRLRQILMARGIKGVVIAPYASGVAKIDFDCTGLCVATAGYSITEPRLHRACPDYLQMMDELIADCTARGYRRVGLVMTYGEAGIGQKLFSSSLLYWQSKIPETDRIPVLPKSQISLDNLRNWIHRYQPEVIISAATVLPMLHEIGMDVPRDIAFASIDVTQTPIDAAGADHRYTLVGNEVAKLVLTMLNLNLTGVPKNPKVVLVDSHRREGFTLPEKQANPAGQRKGRRKKAGASKSGHLTFRGFLD